MAALARNAWQVCPGFGGRFRSECPAGLIRIQWQVSAGLCKQEYNELKKLVERLQISSDQGEHWEWTCTESYDEGAKIIMKGNESKTHRDSFGADDIFIRPTSYKHEQLAADFNFAEHWEKIAAYLGGD